MPQLAKFVKYIVDFFSRTASPILFKFGGDVAWVALYKVCTYMHGATNFLPSLTNKQSLLSMLRLLLPELFGLSDSL